MAGGAGAAGGGGAFLTTFGTGIGRRSAGEGAAVAILPLGFTMMLTAPDLTKDVRIRSYKAELNRTHICCFIIL